MTGDSTTDVAALAARLQRVEDLLEIHQLFVDYGRHLDAGDFDAYAELFAADGEVLLGPMGRAKGPAAIKALMEQALAGTQGSSVHVISSPAVELAGDRATSEVMWTVVRRDGDGQPGLGMVGRHRDELVREGGRWKFLRRKGLVDIPSAMPAGAPGG
jgi:ketosteroid isomerase-like protein